MKTARRNTYAWIAVFLLALICAQHFMTRRVNATPAAQSKLTPVKNKAPLSANAFNPLPLTSIKPEGWLRRQLQIQANGLTGHLPDFWADVGPNSGWLGGKGEHWERGPYYTDGLIPLAYLLNDPKLKVMANKWVEWTLTHQQESGAIAVPEALRSYMGGMKAIERS